MVMKFRLLLFTFFISIGINAIAQCPPNGLNLMTQADVDAFLVNYPDCTKINEDLFIGQFGSDVTDLSPLSNLTQIDGSLIMQYFQGTDLSPLFNLEEIGRDLKISFSNASTFTFPNLTTVGKSVGIGGHNNLIVFQGLNNLTFIGEDLNMSGNENLIEINGFDQLEIIEENCDIINNPNLETISGLNALDTIFNSLRIYDSPSLTTIFGFSNLKHIGYDFSYTTSGLINLDGFNQLESIENNIYISSNAALERIDGFQNLKTVGKDLVIRYSSGMDTLNGFPALTEVREDLLVEFNESLVDIVGFPALTNVIKGLSFKDNDLLKDVNGFNSLQSFDAFLWFQNNPMLESINAFRKTTRIGDGINFTRNHFIQNLDALANVQSIGDNLIISDNDNLKNLDSLENLKSINGYISIKNNDVLSSIEGIRNIDPISITGSFGTDLILTGNLSLEECQIRSICTLLSLPGKVHEIENNKAGCNTAEEIECYQIALGGYTFYDTNADGIQDENEFGISNQSILLSPDNYNSLTDQNGLYYLFPPTDGNYKIEWQQNPLWNLSSDSSAYNVEIINGEIPEELLSFGLTPNFSEERASISIASQQTRCNQQVAFTISYKNTGTFLLSGDLLFTHDENTSYVFSDLNPLLVDDINQMVRWNIEDLYPQESREITLILYMPSELFTGTYIDFTGQLFLGQNGMTSELSKSEYSSEVRCSYDPNDKLVNPIGQGIENLTTPDTTLNYTVRFQNTGNAEAINIYILDTIDSKMNIETFKVTGSSFPVQTVLRDNIVRFNFNNIFLPDSLSDPAGSQGFVSFTIDPVPDLPDPTEVYNSASIYFDQNPPILTNTAVTIYGTPMVSVDDPSFANQIKIFPNPVRNEILITIKDFQFKQLRLSLKDVSGKEIMAQEYGSSVANEESIKLNVGELNPGIYFITFQTEQGTIAKKVVKN